MKDISFFEQQQIAVIPLRPASKTPTVEDWPSRSFEDNDSTEYDNNSNIGVVLGTNSNGIIDIDLDTPDAIKLAPFFLPKTGWIFGRKTAPKSHRIYRVTGDPGATVQIWLRDEMFAEYRANGGMTVFPGSIHMETGEAIEWSECDDPTVASRDELVRALRKMSITSAVIPKYKKGSRNNTVNALVGTLLFYGMATSDIKDIIEVLCHVTTDEEAESRLASLDRTEQRKLTNEPVTSEQQLRHLIGEEAVTSIISYLGGRKNSAPDVNRPASTTSNLFYDDEKNDMGVAARFAKRKKGEVVYVEKLGSFFTYNGQIWEQDSGVRITKIFGRFVREELADLRSDKSIQDSELNRQSSFLLKYLNRRQCENAISLSKSAMDMPMSGLDSNRDLIAVQNGILNLRTGALLDFDPSYYITRQLGIVFDSEAVCPLFESFLETIFVADKDLISYVQGILGYALTPEVNRQELYFFHGSGANGKSTLLNVIRRIFGQYSASMMKETLFDKSTNNTDADLATLRGVRLTVVQEAESDLRLNAPRVKAMTGGDILRVAAKYKDPFDLVPEFKPIVLCNNVLPWL